MALISIWSNNPTEVSQFTIDQIVPIAGDGSLRDGSSCSGELREYLSQVQTSKLEDYAGQLLNAHFPKSGFVLQDVINEFGTRLGYKVTPGRYQGVAGGIGFDGIWRSPESHSLVVEVKTTDAYRVSLDTIAKYRQGLIDIRQISGPSSILIVVGRQDTGELEAQVRRSRHAWDIRLISAEALVKLAKLAESVEGLETGQKIRALLVPREYTKLDDMIDVMFAAAKDAESAAELDTPALDAGQERGADESAGWQFTDGAVIQAKRDAIMTAMCKRLGTALIRRSRALYWNASHDMQRA